MMKNIVTIHKNFQSVVKFSIVIRSYVKKYHLRFSLIVRKPLSNISAVTVSPLCDKVLNNKSNPLPPILSQNSYNSDLHNTAVIIHTASLVNSWNKSRNILDGLTIHSKPSKNRTAPTDLTLSTHQKWQNCNEK